MFQLKISSLESAILSFIFFVEAASPVRYLYGYISINLRWYLIIVLFIVIFLKLEFRWLWKSVFGISVLTYSAWCLLTSFWSEVFLLSLMKALAFALVSFTMVAAGSLWVSRHRLDQALDYLWLFVLVSILAVLMGTSHRGEPYAGGLLGSSNMLGYMMQVSFIFLLWKSYCAGLFKPKGFMWSGLSLACIFYLILSMTRSSFLATFIMMLIFLVSSKLMKIRIMLPIALIFISFFFGAMVLSPGFNLQVQSIIYKNNQNSHNLFETRMSNWIVSYEAALKGNVVGIGYGVSYGAGQFNLTNDLSAMSYGREKGNSQLGIVEELGLIGFFFYLGLLFLLYKKIRKIYQKFQGYPEARALVGLVAGGLAGLTVQSLFEAWWGAPGSPESIFFWSLVGVIVGLENIAREYKFYVQEQA